MQKIINWPKSKDFIKKIQLTMANRRVAIYRNEYQFIVFVGAKSFRKLENTKKEFIKKKIERAINKRVDFDTLDKLYEKKLAVRLELFLSPSYIKRADIDNVAKTVLDCMTNIVYKDDKQIYSLDVIKSISKKGAIGVTIGELKSFRCISD